MRVPKNKRNKKLTDNSSFPQIDKYIKHNAGIPHLPNNALVLDEDVKKHPHTRWLQKSNLRFKYGRGVLNNRKRVSVTAADDLFSSTEDEPLLKWCHSHEYQLITCNVIDFKQLDKDPSIPHSGIIICINQPFTHKNPRIIAKKVNNIYDNNRLTDFQDNIFVIQP